MFPFFLLYLYVILGVEVVRRYVLLFAVLACTAGTEVSAAITAQEPVPDDVITEECIALEAAGAEKEEEEPVIEPVEQMPVFMEGGLDEFRVWAMQEIVYPQVAMENGITGRVIVSFVIEKNGRLNNIKVLKTPDDSLSDEVVRVLKLSPLWTPAVHKGEEVRVRMDMPVDFRL